jgi:hypothetical protein
MPEPEPGDREDPRPPARPASHVLSVIASDGCEWFRNDPAGRFWVTEDLRQISWLGLVSTYGPLRFGQERVRYE